MAGVRQADIAKRCGVSQQAVAFALSANPSVQRKLSSATRKRILLAAREMGYVTNHAASSLRNGKTQTIVLATTVSLVNPFASERIEAIHVALRECGYHLLLELMYDTPDEASLYGSLASGRYDGVIMYGLTPVGRRQLPLLVRSGVPILVTRNKPLKGVSTVDHNVREAARMGVEHLLARGHRKIAMVHGVDDKTNSANRLGYRTALAAAGIAVNRGLLFKSAVADADTYGLWARISAARPTAVYCYNAELAAGLLRAMRAGGLRVPDDVALVTHTNTQLTRQVDVPLTAVDVNSRDMARTIAAELVARIANPRQPPRHFRLQPVLIARESSGGPGLQNARLSAGHVPPRGEK